MSLPDRKITFTVKIWIHAHTYTHSYTPPLSPSLVSLSPPPATLRRRDLFVYQSSTCRSRMFQRNWNTDWERLCGHGHAHVEQHWILYPFLNIVLIHMHVCRKRRTHATSAHAFTCSLMNGRWTSPGRERNRKRKSERESTHARERSSEREREREREKEKERERKRKTERRIERKRKTEKERERKKEREREKKRKKEKDRKREREREREREHDEHTRKDGLCAQISTWSAWIRLLVKVCKWNPRTLQDTPRSIFGMHPIHCEHIHVSVGLFCWGYRALLDIYCNDMSKEPYIWSKEPCILSKEPYSSHTLWYRALLREISSCFAKYGLFYWGYKAYVLLQQSVKLKICIPAKEKLACVWLRLAVCCSVLQVECVTVHCVAVFNDLPWVAVSCSVL